MYQQGALRGKKIDSLIVTVMIPTPFVVFVQKSLEMTRSKARKRVPFEWIVALVVYMTTSASPYRVTGLASVVNFNILSPNSLTINLIMNPFVVLVQKSLFMTRFFFKSSVLKHRPSSIFWPSFRKNIPLNELLLLLYPWWLLLHL